jgi:hypothetical protein
VEEGEEEEEEEREYSENNQARTRFLNKWCSLLPYHYVIHFRPAEYPGADFTSSESNKTTVHVCHQRPSERERVVVGGGGGELY